MYLLVREEKHVDDSFRLFTVNTDAILAAKEISAFWKKRYDFAEIDADIPGEEYLFCESVEGCFCVYVKEIDPDVYFTANK